MVCSAAILRPGRNGTGRQVREVTRIVRPPVIELWQSQTAALALALNPRNSGGVINLRTSAGKTRVAELAILHTLITDPTAKIIYLAPFRSLAFELERTFSTTLSPLGYSISHLYGGARFSGVDREVVNDSDITIATPEKAKAMLRSAPELFEPVKLIIIDEGHLLGGSERNIRNELFLEHLRILAHRNGARLLLLSAVLPNAEDLAAWVGGDSAALVKSQWKPSAERFGILQWKTSGVSIEWRGSERCFNPHFVEFRQVPKNNKQTRLFPAKKTEAVAATAVRLSEIGPVLIFAGQAQWVPAMANSVLQALGSDAPLHPWPETEWKILEAVCKEELGDKSLEIESARLGVVCHSNKLPPQVRNAVETLMAKCAPRIIVATTTLGQGVNIGVSSVIVATTYIGANVQISKRDFWNICGRAGRAFVDSEGKILFAIDVTRKAWQVKKDKEAAESYFDAGKLDAVESGLLQLVQHLITLAANASISFDTLLELVANDRFDRFGQDKANVEKLFDYIDDQLLALHVAYKGDEQALTVDWVDDAFRESLAVIQEKHNEDIGLEGRTINVVKARTISVLRRVQSAEARRAIIASGLPLSVGIIAFQQLNGFRGMVDHYVASDTKEDALGFLVREFEVWASENAASIVTSMPDHKLLEKLRPQWLAGTALRTIVETCGDSAPRVCAEFYGYQLPWLLHAVSQKLDKETEKTRVEALSTVGLLVELGLPTESAAKIFLAGVRSRAAAVELSRFVTDSSASVATIRKALLDSAVVAALAPAVSTTTLEWLRLMSEEHGSPGKEMPQCARFRLEAPEDVDMLHVRQIQPEGNIWLCSTDARFKYAVQATETMPFDKFANDPRFAFVRDGDAWVQHCRDPRIEIVSNVFGRRM